MLAVPGAEGEDDVARSMVRGRALCSTKTAAILLGRTSRIEESVRRYESIFNENVLVKKYAVFFILSLFAR